MEILAVAVQKGGTGKTTTAAALAQAAAFRGKKVLCIDLDPQANFSFAIGADTTGARGNAYHLLTGRPAARLIQTTPQGVDCIAASWDLAAVTTAQGSARRLQRAIEPLKERYDYIIIDTPPTAGELQYNALQAATGLIIPLQANIFSLQSLYQITETAQQFRTSNPGLTIKGFLLTQHNNRSTIAKQMQEVITQKAAEMGVPSLGAIRAAIAVQEAAALQKSLFEYAPNSKPAQDYLALFDSMEESSNV